MFFSIENILRYTKILRNAPSFLLLNQAIEFDGQTVWEQWLCEPNEKKCLLVQARKDILQFAAQIVSGRIKKRTSKKRCLNFEWWVMNKTPKVTAKSGQFFDVKVSRPVVLPLAQLTWTMGHPESSWLVNGDPYFMACEMIRNITG